MANPIQGTLEIQSTPGGETRIVLNPSQADITAGGNGGSGDLILKNTNNAEVIRLGRVQEVVVNPQSPSPIVIADYTGLRVRTASGVNIIQIGRMAPAANQLNQPHAIETIFGGTGFTGMLRLVDKNNKTRFILGRGDGAGAGNQGDVIVRDGADQDIFYFDGQNAALYIGSKNNEGDIIVRDNAGNDSIFLNGGGHVLILKDKDAKEIVRLNAEPGGDNISVQDAAGKRLLAFDNEAFGNTKAGLFLGAHITHGGNKPGVIALRDDAGNDSISLDGGGHVLILRDKDAKEIVRLNAEPGGDNISVQDAAGKRLLAFDNEAFGNTRAGLFLGAHITHGGSKPGVIALRDNAGNDSIFLDGSKGDIILANADCAEDFDIAEAEEIEPGTVIVLDRAGQLRQSKEAYDKKVAGVISGAGDYRPGIVLGKQNSLTNRMPVALVGKVYCKVDAQYSSIEVGDLLTTSPTPGHAMKADDPLRAFGAVIGKALRPLEVGQGLIPILVALQ